MTLKSFPKIFQTIFNSRKDVRDEIKYQKHLLKNKEENK